MKKLVCMALLLAGCSDVLGGGGVRVVPEQEAYAAFNDIQPVTVRYTVANDEDTPISIPTCGGANLSVRIQRKQSDGEWATLTPPTASNCLAVFAPRVVESGGTTADSVTVQGFGTWRVLVPYVRQGSAVDTAYSREFQTRTPPD